MAQKFRSILARAEHQKAQSFFKSKSDYDNQLKLLQKKFMELQRELHGISPGRSKGKPRKMVVLFEGPDAAGKGGVIKRMTEFLDPRGVAVQSIGKPNMVEIDQHYLQRFFTRFPVPGSMTVFDRSWYGRVLVERVEELCPKPAWKRAYSEINAMEAMLVHDGVLVLKYLLDISYDEQKIRFDERKKNPFKAWKLTDEDLRNRKKWPQYEAAYHDLLKHTSTDLVPWTVVPADSKWFARVAVMNDVVARTERFLSKGV